MGSKTIDDENGPLDPRQVGPEIFLQHLGFGLQESIDTVRYHTEEVAKDTCEIAYAIFELKGKNNLADIIPGLFKVVEIYGREVVYGLSMSDYSAEEMYTIMQRVKPVHLNGALDISAAHYRKERNFMDKRVFEHLISAVELLGPQAASDVVLLNDVDPITLLSNYDIFGTKGGVTVIQPRDLPDVPLELLVSPERKLAQVTLGSKIGLEVFTSKNVLMLKYG